MRILYILPEFPPEFGGGIATVYGQLLPRLCTVGHDITVLLARLDPDDQGSYHWEGVEVVPLQHHYLQEAEQTLAIWRRHTFLYNFLPIAWAAWNQAQEMGSFDVVETTDWALLYLPWLLHKRRQPVVLSLHGSCGQVDWYSKPYIRHGEGQLVRLLEAASLPLANALIANSKNNAEFWRIQCGVSPNVIPPIFESPTPLSLPYFSQLQREQHHSQHGLVIGRVQNWKGPELLCQALRLLPDVQMDWVGEDTTWEEGPAMTSSYLRQAFPDVVDRQLHFLGSLPPHEVRQRILDAPYLCIPSTWDVFNMTSLEAVAFGRPVICSNQAGASMLFTHQVSGYLFDACSPTSLATQLKSIRESSVSERSLMAQKASADIAMLVSASDPIQSYLELYSHLVRSFSEIPPSEWLISLVKHGDHPAMIQRTSSGVQIVKSIRHKCANIIRRSVSPFKK